MGPKKIKKLVLKQEIISNLSKDGMSKVKGGETWFDGEWWCIVASQEGLCVSEFAQDSGYGMCCVTATALCCSNNSAFCP